VVGGRLAQGAVVLSAAPDARRILRHRGDRGELADLKVGRMRSLGKLVDAAVQVLPIDVTQSGVGAVAAAASVAVPDAAVAADQDVRRVAGVEGERVEVGVLVPAEVSPRLPAVHGAKDTARVGGKVGYDGAGG